MSSTEGVRISQRKLSERMKRKLLQSPQSSSSPKKEEEENKQPRTCRNSAIRCEEFMEFLERAREGVFCNCILILFLCAVVIIIRFVGII